MTALLPGLAATVLEDRYPVPVRLPSGSRLDRVRMVLTAADGGVPGRLRLFTAVAAPVVDVVWDPAGSQAGSRGVEWSIATEVGVFTVEPGRGCRCGRLGSAPLVDGPERRESLSRVLRRAREAAA